MTLTPRKPRNTLHPKRPNIITLDSVFVMLCYKFQLVRVITEFNNSFLELLFKRLVIFVRTKCHLGITWNTFGRYTNNTSKPKKLQKRIKMIVATFICSVLTSCQICVTWPFCFAWVHVRTLLHNTPQYSTPKSTPKIVFKRYFILITVDCG